MASSSSSYHFPSTLVLRSEPSLRLVHTLNLTNPNNSWLGTKIRVQIQPCSISTRSHVSVFRRRPFASTVSFSLPISNPERVSSGQEIPKWSSKAIKSIAMAALEARKIKHTTTGSEALIMGVLIEGTNLANKFLRAHGITLFKVRDEIVKVVGEADEFSETPERPPMTDDAQKALDWAVDKKLKSVDGGEVTTAHIILGIWSDVDSPGHKILSNLGINDEKVKELESSISKPVTDD